MLEIEMKFPVRDLAELEQRLGELPATAAGTRCDADHYFNAPDRDFGRTDEALRLRRIGDLNKITYKGPRQPGPSKTRTEIEIPLGSGDQVAGDFSAMLKHLGYRPVAVVRKRRRLYRMKQGGFALEICLDEVEGLGNFAEIEIMAAEDQVAAAQAVLSEVASALYLAGSERRSYLEMLLQATAGEKRP